MAWTNPASVSTGDLVTATWLNTYIRDNMNAMLPVGSLIYRVATHTTVETAVEGRWLECNGVAVSRSTYATLFAYLNGLTPALPFGNGDGATSFTLPDFRGRTPVGVGSHADVTLGDNDGTTESKRKPKHWHNSQYGSTSAGGTIPVATQFDTTVTATFPTTPATSTGDRANHPQDAPAYLVGGVFYIKYTA